MKKGLIIYLVFLCSFSYGQWDDSKQTPKVPLKDRIFFGGDLSLLFGTTTLIDVSPLIGYKLTPSISIGAGPIYQYYRFRTSSGDFQTTTYGGRGMARYYFSQQFFAHAEFQQLSLETLNIFTYQLQRVNVPVGLIGGGYLQEISGNFYVNIQVLIDVINDINSPYISPVIRGGIIINPF